MKKRITNSFFFVCLASILLSGCVAAELSEALAAEDVAAVAEEESVYLRSASVVRLSATEGAVVDDIATLNSSLRRIRLAPSTTYSSSPRLLYTVNGETRAIAEITSENSIRMLRSGKIIRFPEGKIYTVRNNLVNVRTSPIVNNYNAFAHVEKNEIVLVLEENNGWSKIQIGKDQIGYIKAELLAPIILAAASNNSNTTIHQTQTYSAPTATYKKVTCDYCYGKGYTICNTCYGKGEYACNTCYGKGSYTCYSCSGSGYYKCYTCQGRGYSACYTCNGYGYLNCGVCNGYGYTLDQYGRKWRCNNCSGYGKFLCQTCQGNKNIICSSCNGQRTFTCSSCYGHGFLTCSSCNGAGKFQCSSCNGAGQFKCSKCHGSGVIQVNNNW